MSELYHQCAGLKWVTTCRKGLTCVRKDQFYSQCLDLGGLSDGIPSVIASAVHRHEFPQVQSHPPVIVNSRPIPISSDLDLNEMPSLSSLSLVNSAFPHSSGGRNDGINSPASPIPVHSGPSNAKLVQDDQEDISSGSLPDSAGTLTTLGDLTATSVELIPTQTLIDRQPSLEPPALSSSTPSSSIFNSSNPSFGIGSGGIIAILVLVCLGFCLLATGMVVLKRRRRRQKAQEAWLKSSLS